jgi:lysozyme
MRNKATFVTALLIAASIYLAYRASGADDVSGLWDWLRSLATRVSLRVNSLAGGLMKIDGTTLAVSKALDFIANQEGFSRKAYPDPPGQTKTYSIGYGHQIVAGDGLSLSSILDEATAYQLLTDDVQRYVDCVLSVVTVELTPEQTAALISFCYNEGCGAFRNSTLVKRLNAGDVAGAASEFGKWIYAAGEVNQGLVARRADEQTLFES